MANECVVNNVIRGVHGYPKSLLTIWGPSNEILKSFQNISYVLYPRVTSVRKYEKRQSTSGNILMNKGPYTARVCKWEACCLMQTVWSYGNFRLDDCLYLDHSCCPIHGTWFFFRRSCICFVSFLWTMALTVRRCQVYSSETAYVSFKLIRISSFY